MNYISEEQKQELFNAINRKFTSVLFFKIELLADFINMVSEIREDFPDHDEALVINKLDKAREINAEINSLIDKQFKKREDYRFNNIFPGLLDLINSLISTYKPSLVTEQKVARFTPLDSDPFFVKFMKQIKLIIFDIYNSFRRFRIIITGKLKNQPIDVRFWRHTIPLQNLAFYYLRDSVLKALATIYEDVCREYSKTALAFWEYDENIDQNFYNNFVTENESIEQKTFQFTPAQLVENLQNFMQEISVKVNNEFVQCFLEFESACEKTGTIEFSKRKFTDSRIIKYHDHILSEFEKIIREWDNTHFALGEEWQLDYDLESVRYSSLRAYYKFDKSLSVKIKIQVQPLFESAAEILNDISRNLSDTKPDKEIMSFLLRNIKSEVKSELLATTLPGLINTISDIQIPEMIDDTGKEVNQSLNYIKEVRTSVNASEFDSKIKLHDLEQIYPREYLKFTAVPAIKEKFSDIITKLESEREKIQSELINLGNMVDFSLESALTALRTKELKENEAKEIVLEGLKISKEKNEEIKNDYQNICNIVLEEIDAAILFFNSEIIGFTKASELNEIRMQIGKSKAKIKAKETRAKIYTAAKNFIPMLFLSLKKINGKNIKASSTTQEPTGLNLQSVNNDSEVSDFILRVDTSIEKLPYIYRRLFQVKELESERLYLNRNKEEQQLQIAFKNWMNGGYAPLILTSEKGGGKTTFLNLNVLKLTDQFSITRLSIKPTVYTEEGLLELFRTIVNIESLSNHSEIIAILNKAQSRRIIVLENLQHLYLRTVNGFSALKLLLEIITKTNKNIFWLTSATQYAFEYLKKSMKISDYFGYHINLEQISDGQITGLIRRRHSISGYSLQYIAGEIHLHNKDALKLNENDYQKFLEKEFFSSLNFFTKSNISLAQLFWLSSIQDIKDRILYISANFEISDSILNSLSAEKVFILHSLILQDGLKSDEINKTLNYSFNETSLLLQVMLDDGIIIKTDDTYYINPLVYRQTITLLKSRNYLD